MPTNQNPTRSEMKPMIEGGASSFSLQGKIEALEIEEEFATHNALHNSNDDTFQAYDYHHHTSAKLRRITLLTLTALLLLTLSTISLHSSLTNPTRHAPSHPSFHLERSTYLPSYDAVTHLYTHTQTQAQFFTFIPADKSQDKTFGISFRTLPTDDTGVPHILEHSVLSGSRSYPAKDPFLHMMKGSLQTFLNAMTYNDRTVFPIASRNAKDYGNLMGVYLDAVFHPRCVEPEGEWILRQEGWRYDITYPDDEMMKPLAQPQPSHTQSSATLEYKGVVYSEMKGVFSNPESLSSRATSKFLFPSSSRGSSHPYHYESGGMPKDIPTLTHDEFVQFYRRHYHPTNAQIFASGTKDDVEGAMTRIDGYLSEFQHEPLLQQESKVPFQPKLFPHHVYQSLPYAVATVDSTTGGQHLFSITWLLNDSHLPPATSLALSILDRLIIDTPSSPLNRLLIESRLGSQIIGYGLEKGLLQDTFAVGLRGVKGEDVIRVEALILDVLGDLAREVFGEGDIAGAMNSIEFKLRDVTSQSASQPLGITIFQIALTKWNYDLPPEDALQFEDTLLKLKRQVKKEGSQLFQDLIKEYLLDNNHRVHLELHPSATLEAQMDEEEKKTLLQKKNSFTPIEWSNIQSSVTNLHTIQTTEDTPATLATIPSLALSDLSPTGVEYPFTVDTPKHSGGITLLKTPVSGSFGIVNIHFGIDLAHANILWEDVGLLPFFASMMKEGGTSTFDEIEIAREIDIHTGGISIDILTTHSTPPSPSHSDLVIAAADDTQLRTLLFLEGKCTSDQTEEMLDLFMDLLANCEMDRRDKALQILDREMSTIRSSIQSRGHTYAVKRMAARYDPLSLIDEEMSGVSQLLILEQLASDARDRWPEVRERLESLKNGIWKALGVGVGSVISLTGAAKVIDEVERDLKRVLSGVVGTTKFDKSRSSEPHPWLVPTREAMKTYGSGGKNEGIVVSSQVSYVGKEGLMYNPNDEINGSTDVVLHYLKKGYLWHTVREQNGAYGVFVDLNHWVGSCYFVSYRDPLIKTTLDAYDATADSIYDDLKTGAINPDVITTAIIGSIGMIDGSAPPPSKIGFRNLAIYLSGRTTEHRQRWREEILNVVDSDFADFAHRLKNWMNPSVAVVGSNSSFQKAKGDGLDLKLVSTNPSV